MILPYCLIILGIFRGDLRIKNRIERNDPALPASLWNNRILIRRHHNKGAALNLGQSRSSAVAVLSVLLCILMTAVFLLSLGHRGNVLLRTGLALLLGGSFSNTYDRLKRKYVVDYFSWNVTWAPLRRIVFNLSDFCIMAGALMTVLAMPD